MALNIKFGSLKKTPQPVMKEKVIKVTISDEPEKTRGIPRLDFINFGEVEPPNIQKITKQRFFEEDLDTIRNTKPKDLFDEMMIAGKTIYKQANDSMAVRDNKTKLCEFYCYKNGEWVGRFNVNKRI